jgi:hypothetical protein
MLQHYQLRFPNDQTSSYFSRTINSWEIQLPFQHLIQTLSQKLFMNFFRSTVFFINFVITTQGFNPKSIAFVIQNVFVALVLQRHLQVDKPHQPYLIHALPLHQNQRDQEYQ